MIQYISGGIAKDHRGHIKFVNDFDMSLVKRFFIIKNADTELVRGWRGHKIEQRWFYVLQGSFALHLVKIDNWDNPCKDLTIQSEILKDTDLAVLHVPKGYATAFKALEPNSQLLVYGDFGIEHAPNDDHVFPVDYFFNSNIQSL